MCGQLSDIKKDVHVNLQEVHQENIQNYLFDMQGSQGGQCDY